MRGVIRTTVLQLGVLVDFGDSSAAGGRWEKDIYGSCCSVLAIGRKIEQGFLYEGPELGSRNNNRLSTLLLEPAGGIREDVVEWLDRSC